MHIARQTWRFLALLLGATGALRTAATGIWLLIPLQMWPTGYPIAPSETDRWVEISGALIAWVFTVLILSAPAALSLLP